MHKIVRGILFECRIAINVDSNDYTPDRQSKHFQMFTDKEIPRTELSLIISSNTPQHGVQFKREMNEKRMSILG